MIFIYETMCIDFTWFNVQWQVFYICAGPETDNQIIRLRDDGQEDSKRNSVN